MNSTPLVLVFRVVASPRAAAIHELLADAGASTVRDGPQRRSALQGRAPMHFQVCSHLILDKSKLNIPEVPGHSAVPNPPGVQTTLCGMEEWCTTDYTATIIRHTARLAP